tara:strand:+ start:34 stop:390 length:357 start_codon:yes stop_codon:yes gene_type:complete
MSPKVEKSVEQYEVERLQIQEIFGETNFVISLDIEELDDILTPNTLINIQATFFKYVSQNEYVETTNHFVMKKPEGNITKRDALFFLKRVGFTPLDNHFFIESFDYINEKCYSLFLGS